MTSTIRYNQYLVNKEIYTSKIKDPQTGILSTDTSIESSTVFSIDFYIVFSIVKIARSINSYIDM